MSDEDKKGPRCGASDLQPSDSGAAGGAAEGQEGKGELAELERLARAATPGPWELRLGPFGGEVWVVDGSEMVAGEACSDSEAEYIAAANPTVVLGLLERLRSAESLLERELIGLGPLDRERESMGRFRAEVEAELAGIERELVGQLFRLRKEARRSE